MIMIVGLESKKWLARKTINYYVLYLHCKADANACCSILFQVTLVSTKSRENVSTLDVEATECRFIYRGRVRITVTEWYFLVGFIENYSLRSFLRYIQIKNWSEDIHLLFQNPDNYLLGLVCLMCLSRCWSVRRTSWIISLDEISVYFVSAERRAFNSPVYTINEIHRKILYSLWPTVNWDYCTQASEIIRHLSWMYYVCCTKHFEIWWSWWSSK